MPKTRQDFEAAVRGPGKFEGEPPWTAYFYESYLDGSWADDGENVWFEVDDTDRQLFPELADVRWVALWESDSGFISTQTFADRPASR